MGLLLGLLLMVVGIVIFVLDKRSRVHSVKAEHGSVAVGGSNSGTIQNVNQNAAPKAHQSTHSWLTVVSILVELVGIVVVLWHASHMLPK